jgi:hypothetical protein
VKLAMVKAKINIRTKKWSRRHFGPQNIFRIGNQAPEKSKKVFRKHQDDIFTSMTLSRYQIFIYKENLFIQASR